MHSTDCFWFHIYCYNIFTNGRRNIIEILQENFNFKCSLEDLIVTDDYVHIVCVICRTVVQTRAIRTPLEVEAAEVTNHHQTRRKQLLNTTASHQVIVVGWHPPTQLTVSQSCSVRMPQHLLCLS